VPKAEKRRRKKEQRRARLEEEQRRRRTQRRRQLTFIVIGLVLLAGAIASRAFLDKEPEASDKKDAKAASDCPTKEPKMTIDPAKKYRATLATTEGTIVVDLDAQRAPKTVNSVTALANCGFYDGLIFHRVVKDFVIQGGDPEGTGQGGPGYKVVEAPPADLKYTVGTMAMAKAGPEAAGTSGSQFFIVSGTSTDLPPEYAFVGRVASGQDVVDKIQQVPVGEADRPTNPPKITKLTVTEVAGG
jgi:cyclophilin family peptidyl-prolyl cis-trans isomerase